MAASVAEAAAVNPKDTKTLLAYGVSTLFIYGKTATINGLRKVRNPSSWIVNFEVVFSNKISLFSETQLLSWYLLSHCLLALFLNLKLLKFFL